MTTLPGQLSSSNDAAVELRNVSFAFSQGTSRKPVVVDNSFCLARGELVMLTGPSGSGKTTLLSLIGALRTIQDGSLKVFGQELRDFSRRRLVQYRRHLGLIFQHHNLFPALTAAQSVRMALDLHELSEDRKDVMTLGILARLAMFDRTHHKPADLSGGERQRVAVARGLVHDPRLVLADEPTAALDRETALLVVDLFTELVREKGATILMVTHDTRLLHVADRLLRMVDGRIVSDIDVRETVAIGERSGKDRDQVLESMLEQPPPH
jgi:putative ABC transport system ATP-binding protein